MTSISTGKQDLSFQWYTGAKEGDKIIGVQTQTDQPAAFNVAPTLPSQISLHPEDLIPSLLSEAVDKSRELHSSSVLPSTPSSLKAGPLPETPSDSTSLHNHHDLLDFGSESLEYAQSASPLVDRLQPHHSPKEPSRIHNEPIQSFFFNPHKHPYPSNDQPISRTLYPQSTDRSRMPEELPFKRVKLQQDSPLDDASDFRDFNTLSGTDLIDSWFTHRVASEVLMLEEAERDDRIKHGADPVILGRMYKIQKDFMNKLSLKSSVSLPQAAMEKTSAIVHSLSDSLSSLKDAITDKVESTSDALRMSSLQKTLYDIADESQLSSGSPIQFAQDGDRINFAWPRVPSSIHDMEELARSERLASGADPVLFGKWRSINSAVRNKASMSGLTFNESAHHKVDSLIGKATRVLDDAVHYTTEMIGQAGFGNKELTHDAQWFQLQEELERARRINATVDPLLDARKMRVERQLLNFVNEKKVTV